MKHTTHHATLSLAVACIFFNSLIGMDEAHKDVVALPSNGIAVLSFLFTHKSNLFDHKMICSLPINKEWEKNLRDTAQKRRDCLTVHMHSQGFDCDTTIVWHKYGSACGKKVITTDLQGKLLYVLYAGYLGCYRILFFVWDNFAKDIPGFEHPKFNEAGDLYCYGFGKKADLITWAKNQHIVEYCLPQDGNATATARRCGVKVGPFSIYALSQFKSFPALLKTFLTVSASSVSNHTKLYNLKDVIIPDNYRECIPCREYKSFDDLPQELADAINKCYNEQQQENKK